MSHLKERSDKKCLNCGTEVAGRFCQQCGQENVEIKESIIQLLVHFVEDLTHFDGKLWKTLRLLLFKPGSLTQLYMEGRRSAYIHPIRMYLFVSAVFFLFIFTGEVPGEQDMASANGLPTKEIATGINNEINLEIGDDSIQYKTVSAYNAAQQKLPPAKRDEWLDALVKKKGIELNEKYKGDKFKIGKALVEKFEQYFSRMLYISLPIFAFFIWILYRRSKQYFFVDHIIFSIHIYCAFYIVLFSVKMVDTLFRYFKSNLPAFIPFLVAVTLVYYLYKSLRNHFNQPRFKTLLKSMILIILTLLLMGTLMFLFFMFSLFNI